MGQDPDEAKYSGITGTELDVIGQATIWVSFNTLMKAKEQKVLVCKKGVDNDAFLRGSSPYHPKKLYVTPTKTTNIDTMLFRIKPSELPR